MICGTLRVQDGYTALIMAAHNDEKDVVQLLLDAGADTNAKENVRSIHLLYSAATCFQFVFNVHFFRRDFPRAGRKNSG
jgi:hypothetical protein